MNNIQALIKQYAETQDNSVMLALIDELQQRDLLWTAYYPAVRNHYTEMQNGLVTAFIFSEPEFCTAFKEYLAGKKIAIDTMECEKSYRVSLFSDFYRNGIQQLIIDNGQTFIRIKLSEILNEPDFSSLPPQQRPVMNAKLMEYANRFFLNQYTGVKDPEVQTAFMKALSEADYLLPLVMDGKPPKGTAVRQVSFGGASLELAVIPKANGGCYIPVFTDWVEFSKLDRDKTCAGNVISFSDIEQFCAHGQFININPLGFNMLMDRNTVQGIRRRFESKPAAQPQPNAVQPQPNVVQPQPNTAQPQMNHSSPFFEPQSVPEAMMQRLQQLMQSESGILAAYLRCMKNAGGFVYVCVVNFSGTAPAVFQQMAQQVGPLTGGVGFNFVDYNSDIGRRAVQSAAPFYQKQA